ncbi:hypothetical protein AKJ09_07860 [Labilithrix luteola]|uniref:Uncharacterized protein n=1 Tax=Labilithrix luteola TaxID=1391654 RepID=A0A0K1Q6A7_9BACT|nr:hypothetical protein AKJ09_07860 [Labilithrix luteola]
MRVDAGGAPAPGLAFSGGPLVPACGLVTSGVLFGVLRVDGFVAEGRVIHFTVR